jgi:site-specific DNA recombinase
MAKQLRAVGYCRTSGEAQRDNTSIPNQKQSIESFASFQKWKVLKHYVDECKSGSKIAGRHDFQKMMRDAAAGKFDILVVYDITRFGRDGFDILDSARTLRRDFGVDVVATRGATTLAAITTSWPTSRRRGCPRSNGST